MKNANKLTTFLIACYFLLAFGIVSSIIILVTAKGEFKTKDIVTFIITGVALVLCLVFTIILIINRKKSDGNNNNQ